MANRNGQHIIPLSPEQVEFLNRVLKIYTHYRHIQRPMNTHLPAFPVRIKGILQNKYYYKDVATIPSTTSGWDDKFKSDQHILNEIGSKYNEYKIEMREILKEENE